VVEFFYDRKLLTFKQLLQWDDKAVVEQISVKDIFVTSTSVILFLSEEAQNYLISRIITCGSMLVTVWN